MNTKIRTLMIALPLAAAGFTVATPGLAMASDQPGPIIAQPVGGDPKPMDIGVPTPTPDPDPAPQPKGPEDKAPAPQDDNPQGPDDKAPLPQDNDPEGPGDFSNGDPCPTHGVDCTPDGDEGDDPADEPQDQGCFTGCDLPETQADVPEADSVTTPTRVDAGLADAQRTDEGGLELTWLLAAGGLVTATGAAFAARARSRARA